MRTAASDGGAAREIVITREFDAAPEAVFAAWTEPGQVAAPWRWGPRAMTTTVQRMDVRPGGSYRIENREADGRTHPFRGEYLEVARPTRLVYTQVYDVDGHRHRPLVVTVEFEARGGRTRLTSRARPATAAERLDAGRRRMAGRWEASLGRLEALLPALAPA
jgi:uncharacterized protein YndB with AHSA1/START domain